MTRNEIEAELDALRNQLEHEMNALSDIQYSVVMTDDQLSERQGRISSIVDEINELKMTLELGDYDPDPFFDDDFIHF